MRFTHEALPLPLDVARPVRPRLPIETGDDTDAGLARKALAIAEQIEYYRAIADEYEHHFIDAPGGDELVEAFDRFAPTGNVLELACGPGMWTTRLATSAATVTAVDASPEMLRRAARRVDGASVRFVQADLMSWQPDQRFDAVVFGFWLSHVPESDFERFWSLVDDSLVPGGQVFFVDDNHRTEAELVEGDASAVIERRLLDGTAYRIIKTPYEPNALEDRLRGLGWNITVSSSGPFYWGQGSRG